MDPGLVGRDRELAALVGWLDGSASGGRAVLVSGEAGIGKSRLVTALAEQTRSSGRRVLWGRTTEQDGAPPYWPWLQVLEPLGIRAVLEDRAGDDPESERFARFESVARELAGLADAPVVILEDMHRADHASLRLLAHLAERAPASPVFLVITFRPSPLDQIDGFPAALDSLLRLPDTERLELAGLGYAAVAALLGADAAPSTVDQVVSASGGNPLYVGEMARHLTGGGDPAAVPTSIRDSVGIRLRARSAGCIEVVRVGAVIGRTFAAGRVATATGRAAIGCLDDLDEAVGAGLIEAARAPGEFRFVHALVRDAVEATMKSSELPVMHRAVAVAIESYDGTGDDQIADLARHWDAASALGDRSIAAQWCERAAVVADRRLAWEEAARLFDRALELGGPAADPLDEHRRAIGSARARLQCDELAAAIAMCVVAADAARRADRADLMAEAVLVPEGRALESLPLRDVTIEALEALPGDDHARRARLHGQLTHIGYYLDPESMVDHCVQAEAEAAVADDPLAELSAIRARHTLSYGPEYAGDRLVLAERLGRVAQSIRRPSVAIWDPLWRIDALVELGRIPEAIATLPRLTTLVASLGTPIARWHLARVNAALSQAAGRFAESLEHAEEARRLFAQFEGPFAAEGMYLGFRAPLEMHAGWTVELAERWRSIDAASAPPFLGDLPHLGQAETLAAIGDVDGARRAYGRCAPAAGWDPPPSLWLHLHAGRIRLAAILGVHDDLAPLLAALEPFRGLHVGTGGGVVSYLGPVELWLGIGAAALQRWDDADRDLATASDRARAAGAPAFAVHADVERAEMRIARGEPDDITTARSLVSSAHPVAARLGMPEFLGRIETILAGLPSDGPLSPRELEVAALVADGKTNKEIAAALYLSERTAQNHVQHILTKLLLANRTQVAAWYRDRSAPGGD